MTNEGSKLERRAFLKMAAGLAVIGPLTAGVTGGASAAAVPPAATGKPGDFDFLTGHWKIQNRQMKAGKWDEFEGESTVVDILEGVASVEELRIPARKFSGMGLRLLDVERKLWADYWVNSKSGVMGSTPSWGSFTNGVGVWDTDDVDDGKPVIWRGVWDQITPKSCRWYQAVSRDDGKTWEDNWTMRWDRV